MNCLNNLPYLPTEIWDKIFDIKYSLEMKKHNDYHNPLLEEFKKEYNIIEGIRKEYEERTGYYDATFITFFFHHWADEHFFIENNKKTTADYYFNHVNAAGRFIDPR
jgi:hypothetical protein